MAPAFCFFPDGTELMCKNLITFYLRALSFTHLILLFSSASCYLFLSPHYPPLAFHLHPTVSLLPLHFYYIPPPLPLLPPSLPTTSISPTLFVLLFPSLYILQAYPPVSDKKVIRLLMASISFPLLSWQSFVYCIPEDSPCCC